MTQAQAKSGDKVSVHYTGTLSDGTVFDSSKGKEPLMFTVDSGEVIPGFDQAVLGMQIKETKVVTIPEAEAYGRHFEEMVVDVERCNFPDDITPEVGIGLQLTQPDGRQIMVTIVKVSDSHVTLDANHPLAGKDLTFELELLSIE